MVLLCVHKFYLILTFGVINLVQILHIPINMGTRLHSIIVNACLVDDATTIICQMMSSISPLQSEAAFLEKKHGTFKT